MRTLIGLRCIVTATLLLSLPTVKAGNWARSPINQATSAAAAAPNVTSLNYAIDDGTAEDSLGIVGTTTYDLIWFNTFTRQTGGERISQISVAYGSPFSSFGCDGIPVTVLLYGDANGGSPADATLLYSSNTTIANSNSNTFQTYVVPNIAVPQTFLVGVLARNLSSGTTFTAAMDFDAPTYSGVSYGGYTENGVPLDALHLGNIATLTPMENVGATGNWLVRANGVPVPEPASVAITMIAMLATTQRLGIRKVAGGARRSPLMLNIPRHRCECRT